MRQVERVAQLKGLACADRVETTGRFLRQAIDELANARNVAHFEMWAEQALADRAGRHGAAIKSWLAIADAAPALGMAGTIIGLIRMRSEEHTSELQSLMRISSAVYSLNKKIKMNMPNHDQRNIK